MAFYLNEAGVADLWEKIKDGDKKASGLVGDIKVTTRTDLGDNWYLCNGAKIDPLERPDLLNVLKDLGTSRTGTLTNEEYVYEKYNNFGYSETPSLFSVCRVNGWTFYSVGTDAYGKSFNVYAVSVDDVVYELLSKVSYAPVEGVYKDGHYVLRCFTVANGSAISHIVVLDERGDGGVPSHSWTSASGYNVSTSVSGLEIDSATGELYLVGCSNSYLVTHMIDLVNKAVVEKVFRNVGSSQSVMCRPVVHNGYVYAITWQGSGNAGHVVGYSVTGSGADWSVGYSALPSDSNLSSPFALIHNGYIYASLGNGRYWRCLLETSDAEILDCSTNATNYSVTSVDEEGFFTSYYNNGRLSVYRHDFENDQIVSKGSFSLSVGSEISSVSTNRSDLRTATKPVISDGLFSVDFVTNGSPYKHIFAIQTLLLPTLSFDGAYAYIKLEEDNV